MAHYIYHRFQYDSNKLIDWVKFHKRITNRDLERKTGC